jgi:hypothetical protein
MKIGKSKTVNFLTLSSNKIGQQCSQLSFKFPRYLDVQFCSSMTPRTNKLLYNHNLTTTSLATVVYYTRNKFYNSDIRVGKLAGMEELYHLFYIESSLLQSIQFSPAKNLILRSWGNFRRILRA